MSGATVVWFYCLAHLLGGRRPRELMSALGAEAISAMFTRIVRCSLIGTKNLGPDACSAS